MLRPSSSSTHIFSDTENHGKVADGFESYLKENYVSFWKDDEFLRMALPLRASQLSISIMHSRLCYDKLALSIPKSFESYYMCCAA